jgi:LIM domain kinase 1
LLLQYILRELAMLRAVTHPNIVQFLGLCRHKQEVYVVTEYVPRGDLMEVLHSTQHPPLSWSLRVYLMMEITKPLAYLHSRNIVHRDVKLENVLVGQNWSIKLCDFGFARCMDNVETKVRDSRMRKMTVAGTDQWMAPEVLMQQP